MSDITRSDAPWDTSVDVIRPIFELIDEHYMYCDCRTARWVTTHEAMEANKQNFNLAIRGIKEWRGVEWDPTIEF